MEDYTNDAGATFTFVLTDEADSGMAGKSYYLYDDNKKLIEDDAQQTKDDGTFELTPNQTAVFVGIEPDTIYSVTEKSQKGFIQTFPSAGGGYSNKVVRADAIETLPFINDLAKETGTLAVSMTVRNGTEESYTRKYKFTVTLDDPTISDTFGDFTFHDGVAEIEIMDGETKYANGLPAGVHYTVTEDKDDQKHFTIISDNETGVIPENDTITAAFVNEAVSNVLPYSGGPGRGKVLFFASAAILIGFCILQSASRRRKAAGHDAGSGTR